jgi:glycosyltransferase involved in cell wall biosynthesis
MGDLRDAASSEGKIKAQGKERTPAASAVVVARAGLERRLVNQPRERDGIRVAIFNETPMRIAQVSPLFESVPPQSYGGTERVVSYLTEELVRQGHDVTLFASGDSITRAELVAVTERSLRLSSSCVDHLAHHILMLEEVARMAEEFDLIHYHIDYLHFPLSRRIESVHVTTLHGRLDLPDLVPLYQEFPDMPVVSISEAQREPLSWINWVGTVHHGIPSDLYSFCPDPAGYLAFVGRISPEKRLDRAIQIARRTGIPLKVAAKIDVADAAYFQERIEPLLDDPLVEYLGEVGDDEKNALIGGAYALLFPIDWPEPFGLVMIEAMACGTPVIAYNHGSVPEIIDEGVTGFVVTNIDEAVEAVGKIPALSRRRCRDVFETRFTADRMARDYLTVYEQLLEAERPTAWAV